MRLRRVGITRHGSSQTPAATSFSHLDNDVSSCLAACLFLFAYFCVCMMASMLHSTASRRCCERSERCAPALTV
jgi:hypothetical protein|eukprot:COSAG06_NODE_8363_length_2189_cov_48.041070_4_plen_74_part_00